jgi:BASS family bile acid:Na+ symporter
MHAGPLTLAIEASIMLTVLSVGLQGSLRNMVYAFTLPALFLRALIAVNVVVPLVAVILCLLFPLPASTRAGIVIMAVSPVCPLALGKMLKAGADKDFVIGIYVGLVVASIVLVPVTVEILDFFLGRDFVVPIADVARLVALTILLPLVVGLLIARLFPGLAAGVAPIVSILGYVMLVPILLLLLQQAGPEMLALLGNGTLFIIAATTLAAFAAGHWLAGPDPRGRLALAMAAATRHPGIAVLLAGLLFDDRDVIFAVLLFLFAGTALSKVYAIWLKRHYKFAKKSSVAA